MSTPIKTGAWVLIAERGEYYRCDLYEYHDTVLIARVNPFSMRRAIADDEGLWATMHTYEDMFVGASENCAINIYSTKLATEKTVINMYLRFESSLFCIVILQA